MPGWLLILIFVVAAIVGYLIINKVPTLLHTPLMSGMNALSGITVLGIAAISFAMINVAGGFTVTGRMLKMFKKKEDK